MINHLERMSKEILSQAPQLAQAITENQNSRYPELIVLDSRLLPIREGLISLFSETLLLDKEERVQKLKVLGVETGTLLSRERSISLDMMLSEVHYYRSSIGMIMKQEALQYDLTAAEMYDVIDVLDTAINDVVYSLSVPFVNHEKELHKKTQSVVRELSVPIVTITEHIAVLPIIGSFDHERVFSLQEVTLFQASKLGLHHLIIDLSGLETTDTHVARELFNLFDALTLLGIQPTVSGIKPSIAITLVQLGLTFGKVKSFATLKQALAFLK